MKSTDYYYNAILWAYRNDIVTGVDAKTLAGILGHTNASFTLDTYTHVTGDMQRNASEIVGKMMKKFMKQE